MTHPESALKSVDAQGREQWHRGCTVENVFDVVASGVREFRRYCVVIDGVFDATTGGVIFHAASGRSMARHLQP